MRFSESKDFPQATHVLCIGAGPAGLTAAYLLSKKKMDVVVLEADPQYVGGISKTVKYKGFHFDIGGHRFFSKSKAVEDLWREILPNDFLKRTRSSRIYYRNKFFSYPLKPIEAFLKLGVMESFLCVLSYLKSRLFPVSNPKNFEDWVSNQFGKRLFNIFFKTYTEKVWGMSCKEISSDWAAQRIKGLSLWNAVFYPFLKRFRDITNKKKTIKTLIDFFHYPRKGPGMMWEKAAELCTQQGVKILMGSKAIKLKFISDKDTWEISYKNHLGEFSSVFARHVISSAPIKEIISAIEPSPVSKRAADQLKYRDFLTVVLILKDKEVFSDNWIYIHDSSVKVGRIQNFKSWSPEMVPDPALCCYGMEYFCFEGDGLWNSSDEELVKLAKTELIKLGLAKLEEFIDGCVVRQCKAYPVYDDDYTNNVEIVKNDLKDHYPHLYLVGRNGMHKYNNQDHSMMTAMLTVENILQEKDVYNVWHVNQDAEYHEEVEEKTNIALNSLRAVPRKL